MGRERAKFPTEFVGTIGAVMLSGAIPALQAVIGGGAIMIAIAAWAIQKREERDALSNPPELNWAEIRATQSDALRKILDTDERNKLKGALLSGDVVAWGYTKGYVDPRTIPPTFWQNETLMFGEVDGKSMSYIGAPPYRTWRKETDSPLNARYYDIHFNKAQLQRYFPDRCF